MSRSAVNATRDAMYLLLSQIEYNDFSDLDAYWASLSKAFRTIPLKYKTKPQEKTPLSKLLEILSEQYSYVSGPLVKACKDFEDACDTGSNDSVDDDVLENIQEAAAEFEKEFGELLEVLDKIFLK